MGMRLAAANGATSEATSDAKNVILSAEGTVEVALKGSDAWQRAANRQTLEVGARVRTAAKSRSLIRLQSRIVFRLNELTTVEILPSGGSSKATLDLKAGTIYLFSRDRPQEFDFRTPVATGAIRGTELVIHVEATGTTTVTLLEGAVQLSNAAGTTELASGDQGRVRLGEAPVKSSVLDAVNVIQWGLYYPGIVDLPDLDLSVSETAALSESLAAYRAGNLPRALAAYPPNRAATASAREKVYASALDLTVGQVAEAEAMLLEAEKMDLAVAPVAGALKQVIAAVRFGPWTASRKPATPTEWMAESYYAQSRSALPQALEAAQNAVKQSPHFGFALARVAELQFSLGQTKAAEVSIAKALEQAPHNAAGMSLMGYLMLARGNTDEAINWFDRAITQGGALANAWLGRGLSRMRRTEFQTGREDMQVAALLEANRSILRSYLGKAFEQERDLKRARHELDLARNLDPNDPTPWLYSALVHWEQNGINTAIRDLERSQELNENRGLFRSRLLLDQDRAVRGVHLAALYRDAGMVEVGRREAAKAVSSDFANYSAHLFLAGSYAEQSGSVGSTLRYETPILNELLLANLLAPPEGGLFSQSISHQEYSRLFERDRLGLFSSTEYASLGSWRQTLSQFGLFGGSSYAIDYAYQSSPGQQEGGDLSQQYFSGAIKQRITLQDTVTLQAVYSATRTGDLTQYLDPAQSQVDRHSREFQEPTLLAGYHHEWSPGHHSLMLVGRVVDTLEYTDATFEEQLLIKSASGNVIATPRTQQTGGTAYPFPPLAALDFHSRAVLYSGELEQIWQGDTHTLVVGSRVQEGTFDTQTSLGASSRTRAGNSTGFVPNIPFPVYFTNPETSQELELEMQRISGYGYLNWRVLTPLTLSAGLCYDHLTFPSNHLFPPLTDREEDKDLLAPKVGFMFTPWGGGSFRGAYTKSLGGASFDQSLRLEPSQVAGFNQSFRGLIPESLAGTSPSSEFQTWGASFDQRFPSKTYLGVEGEWLSSEVKRTIGVFETVIGTPKPSVMQQNLDYAEKSLVITVNQLLGDYWSAGAAYRLSQSELDLRAPEIPIEVAASSQTQQQGVLHQFGANVGFTLPCGLFARTDVLWLSQDTSRDNADSTLGDDVWQNNLYFGYRWPRRVAELRIGLLNLFGQDYRLSPLNLHANLPRERMLTLSLRFNL